MENAGLETPLIRVFGGMGLEGSDGPVVYSGAKRYIQSELAAIKKACKDLDRRLVLESGKGPPHRLRGASLVLHLRLAPHDTPLNRWCKPQVKLENAAAAGCPVLASGHPSVTSLRPGVPTAHGSWAESIAHALSQAPLANPVSLEDHRRLIRQCLGQR